MDYINGGSNSGKGNRLFLFSRTYRLILRSTGFVFGRCQGCESEYSPPPRVEVTNEWSCTSTPSIRLYGEERDNFILTRVNVNPQVFNDLYEFSRGMLLRLQYFLTAYLRNRTHSAIYGYVATAFYNSLIDTLFQNLFITRVFI